MHSEKTQRLSCLLNDSLVLTTTRQEAEERQSLPPPALRQQWHSLVGLSAGRGWLGWDKLRLTWFVNTTQRVPYSVRPSRACQWRSGRRRDRRMVVDCHTWCSKL